MKKTEINKLKFLQHLAELKELTPVSVGGLAKEFKLGYCSLCLEILERTNWIEKERRGNTILVKWISKQYPDNQLSKMVHILLREELDKRYPEKYTKKKKEEKLKGGEAILTNVTNNYKEKDYINFKEAYKAINNNPLLNSINNTLSKNETKGEQILLPLNDISTEEQKQKEAIQKIKINLLTALNRISADFQKKINDIAKEINSINTILVLLLAGAMLFTSCGNGSPEEEEVIIDPVEALKVKSTSIDSAPDSVKALYNEYQKIIAGDQITDIVPASMKPEVYALKYHKLAQEEERLYNIPSCITLAQGILESGNGESRLATENNNHFGVKCFSRKCKKGHCTNFNDDSHKDFFRKYKSVEESYRAHSLFLQRSRYKPLKKCKNYKEYSCSLLSCGYATDKTYDKKLIRIIKDYDLTRYNLK